jgi:hypothetical protein
VKKAGQTEPEDDHAAPDGFDPNDERLTWGPQEYEEWWKYLDEMAADATPADWWEHELKYVREPERLEKCVSELVAAGCRRVDLLEALHTLSYRYCDSAIPRTMLLKQSKLIEKIWDLYGLPLGPRFTFEDWSAMQRLIRRYAEHLRQEAERSKRSPHWRRRQAVTELLELVQRDAGKPNHRLVLELLQTFVDPKLTAGSLRKVGSRALLPKRRASKPKVPARRKTKSGRKVRLSGHVIGRRVNQAKARAGLDDWDDE